MKELININNSLVMTSLEIAKLTGKMHKNVLADVNNILKELGINSAEISAQYKDASGKSNRMFNLNKELTMTLVTGYSIKLRNAVIKRWQELESQQKPMTQLEIARLTLDKLIAQEREVAETKQLALTANKRLDQIETGIDHFTVIGYMRAFLNKSIPLKEAIALGKKATKICNDMGILMGTVPDPRFGQVNTYPKSVLDEVVH